MSFDEIETFLSVAHHANIARAANNLFISQGTASSRIQSLENELGVQLFFRQKGIKQVTLTPEGEYFLKIAQQWLSLDHQAQQIKNLMIFRELRIAAVDTLNQFHFLPIYQRFTEQHPSIRLYLQTEHSTEIYSLIESQQIDIGFAFSLHRSMNVSATALYQENSVILYPRKHIFYQTHNDSDLLPEDEIYSTFGNDYDLWHRRRFPNYDHPKITLGTFSMLPYFIGQPNIWTILPQSLADIIVNQQPELCYDILTEDPPPTRTAYILQYKYPKPWIRDLLQLFLTDIIEMIQSNPALQLLYHG